MMSRAGLLRFALLALIGLTLAAVSGRLAVHTVNDTPSYVDYPFESLDQALSSIRSPGYPLFLRLVELTVGLDAVPLLQLLLHVLAVWVLIEELLARQMAAPAAWMAALCVLVGCTAADHLSTISTDAPAASLGVICAVGLMHATRTGSRAVWIAAGVCCLLTIAVRPAYLFLIPWFAVVGWMLAVHDDRLVPDPAGDTSSRQRPRYHGCVVAAVVLVALLSWMALRKVRVGEFGLLPFGHQNLSAVLVQTVSPQTLRGLSGDGGELASRVADRLEQDGYELPVDGGLPTMTLEAQWDRINYFVILPIAQDLERDRDAGGSGDPFNVRVHRRIGAMNRQILASHGRGYLRWLPLAARRAVWGIVADIAMHPVFLAMILLGGLTLVVRITMHPNRSPLHVPEGWTALTLVGLTYAGFKLALIILSSPPLGRFADAAAIFLPAVLGSFVIGICGPIAGWRAGR
ncbi:hypothetical protein FYK55_03330 [Roseiconus nitratireducens]|uniref:Dolichyl-phosphate-mannose-protein mannosyltransferase n=1 Tax=Roseiconus nitratireducens TaxID=2605748 RepID=A0A5M6DEK6_9BACT|nr:hypothetical protein [Roseiconus nitratireducens]KAA5545958.1 hypothetical protein FYK55_03330 [Roseiconus nitratireducens]